MGFLRVQSISIILERGILFIATKLPSQGDRHACEQNFPPLTLEQDDQAEWIAGIQVWQVNVSTLSSSKIHSYLQKSLKLRVLMDW